MESVEETASVKVWYARVVSLPDKGCGINRALKMFLGDGIEVS